MSRRPFPQPASVAPNLTPMIDVVFQLFIFFLLVAQFSAQQSIELTLPRLAGDARPDEETDPRAVLNVVPAWRAEEEGGDYRLSTRVYRGDDAGLASLGAALAELKARRTGVELLVRADRTEAYERVHPALDAAARAGIARVQIVTTPGVGAQSPVGAAP